ncbi:hypothetical protein U1Q18_012719 [Sarracenia purpurea var. burkii]
MGIGLTADPPRGVPATIGDDEEEKPKANLNRPSIPSSHNSDHARWGAFHATLAKLLGEKPIEAESETLRLQASSISVFLERLHKDLVNFGLRSGSKVILASASSLHSGCLESGSC